MPRGEYVVNRAAPRITRLRHEPTNREAYRFCQELRLRQKVVETVFVMKNRRCADARRPC